MTGFRTQSGKIGEARRAVIHVDEDGAGGRLDAYLAGHLPEEFSRSRVKSLIVDNHVQLNAKQCLQPKTKLKPGDEIIIDLPEIAEAEPKPENIVLDILFEDDHLIVLNKPPGMVVHPAPGNWSGTLVNALLYHCGETLQGIGGVRRPGIVHRLDKETSGVMVVAKTQTAHHALAAQFSDHGRSGPLERAYLALVWGDPPSRSGTIDAPLGRSQNNRMKRAVVSEDAPDAKEAITHYSIEAGYGLDDSGKAIASLLECRLETGRTHQIRVHLSHIGNPLIGDREYGAHFRTKANVLPEAAGDSVRAFTRQALHAAKLGFEHPETRELMHFEASSPADFTRLEKTLKSLPVE